MKTPYFYLLLIFVFSTFSANCYSYSYDISWYKSPIRYHYYEIDSKEDFEGLIQLINVDAISMRDDTISITTDLSLANLESLNKFDGVLLGNNHTISDLTFPLIDTIANTSVVEGLIFDKSCNIRSGDVVGMLCVLCNGTIKNCINYGAISISSYGYPRVGGLCGESTNGKILKCVNYGNVSASVSGDKVLRVGGVCGRINSSYMIGCCNEGSISANAYQYALSGGLAGDCQGSTMENCKNRGKVSSVLTGTASLTSTQIIQYTGGIVGQAQVNSMLNKCSNFGNVQNNTRHVAGIVAHASRTSLINCDNHGDVTSIENYFYSGACGICSEYDAISLENNKYFLNCINTGSIKSQTKNDIATAAGICYDINYANVGNLLNQGTISASATGSNSREFNIPQYECTECNILSEISSIEEANNFIETYVETPIPLVMWEQDDNGKCNLASTFSCVIEPYAGMALVTCIADSVSNYEIRYVKEGTTIENTDAFSQTTTLENLSPSTTYNYIITLANSSSKVEGSFTTTPIDVQLKIEQINYMSVNVVLNVEAKGVKITEYGVKYRLTEDNQWQYWRSNSKMLIIDSLRDNSIYDIKPYVKSLDTEYEGEYNNFQTPELIPTMELMETTSTTLLFHTINKNDLSPLKYGISCNDKDFYADTLGNILVDSLAYYDNHELYAFVEKTEHKALYNLGSFKMMTFGGEMPLQISPKAAMVKVLADAGYYEYSSSKKVPYDEISIEYRNIYASDLEASYNIIPIKSDDYHEYCITLPFEKAGIYQYRIKATASYYSSGNKKAYKYGDWMIVDTNVPTSAVVTPIFTNFKNLQTEATKSTSISCVNVVGEEEVFEHGIEYKIKDANEFIKIPLTLNNGVLERTFNTLIPNTSYLGRFYNTTTSTTYYSSEFLFDNNGTFSLLNNLDTTTQPDFEELLYFSIITPDLGEIIQEAKYFQSISLEIQPPYGWSINTILLNGEDITEQLKDNVVQIKPLIENTCIIISYEKIATGVSGENITSAHTHVYSVGTSIYIRDIAPETQIIVYNVHGQMIYSGKDTQIDVAQEGVYIVLINDISYKVYVK